MYILHFGYGVGMVLWRYKLRIDHNLGGKNGTIRSRKFNTFIWRQIII